MKLPNGITGFYRTEKNQPSRVSGMQFKQLCFTIIIGNGGKVLEFKEPQYPMNFYDVQINVYNQSFHILLNEYYPYLAFASHVEFGNVQFIDMPQLSKEFRSFYNVLSSKELNEPLHYKFGSKTSILLNDNALNDAELQQIAYQRPERIGDVIFNYLD